MWKKVFDILAKVNATSARHRALVKIDAYIEKLRDEWERA
jgi:hypothetical protein